MGLKRQIQLQEVKKKTKTIAETTRASLRHMVFLAIYYTCSKLMCQNCLINQNCVNSDQTPSSVVSDLCLPFFLRSVCPST